jgi:hypothetical protein
MASITITTDATQDARLAPAFGDKLGLGRNATAVEVKAWLITELQAVVRNYEYQQQQATITTQSFTPL